MALQGFQTSIGSTLTPGYPGQVTQDVRSSTYVNAAIERAQVETVTIGTGTATTYSITKLGETVSYTSAVTTVTVIIAGLVAALQANANIGRKFAITSTSTTILLTARQKGVVSTVGTVSGGGASYAVVISTTATVQSALALGRVAVTRSTYGAVDGIPVASLPTAATGDRIVGAITAENSYAQTGLGEAAVTNVQANRPFSVLESGNIWAEAETAIALNSPLLYRHTTSGAFNKIGAISTSAVAQVDTVTIGTPANSTVYGITKDGEAVTIVSGGSATAAAIIAALVIAFNGNPNLAAKYLAAADGSTGVTITALTAGLVSVPATVFGGGTGYLAATSTSVGTGLLPLSSNWTVDIASSVYEDTNIVRLRVAI
jgi:hypothetical protein